VADDFEKHQPVEAAAAHIVRTVILGLVEQAHEYVGNVEHRLFRAFAVHDRPLEYVLETDGLERLPSGKHGHVFPEVFVDAVVDERDVSPAQGKDHQGGRMVENGQKDMLGRDIFVTPGPGVGPGLVHHLLHHIAYFQFHSCSITHRSGKPFWRATSCTCRQRVAAIS